MIDNQLPEFLELECEHCNTKFTFNLKESVYLEPGVVLKDVIKFTGDVMCPKCLNILSMDGIIKNISDVMAKRKTWVNVKTIYPVENVRDQTYISSAYETESILYEVLRELAAGAINFILFFIMIGWTVIEYTFEFILWIIRCINWYLARIFIRTVSLAITIISGGIIVWWIITMGIHNVLFAFRYEYTVNIFDASKSHSSMLAIFLFSLLVYLIVTFISVLYYKEGGILEKYLYIYRRIRFGWLYGR